MEKLNKNINKLKYNLLNQNYNHKPNFLLSSLSNYIKEFNYIIKNAVTLIKKNIFLLESQISYASNTLNSIENTDNIPKEIRQKYNPLYNNIIIINNIKEIINKNTNFMEVKLGEFMQKTNKTINEFNLNYNSNLNQINNIGIKRYNSYNHYTNDNNKKNLSLNTSKNKYYYNYSELNQNIKDNKNITDRPYGFKTDNKNVFEEKIKTNIFKKINNNTTTNNNSNYNRLRKYK